MTLKQTNFSSTEFAAKKRITRREQFLAEMEQVEFCRIKQFQAETV